MIERNPKEAPILAFKSAKAFKTWLNKHHATSNGIWLKFYKKNSGVKTIIYREALDEALCYGWIDSQAKTFDELAYIQKFTPRRKKSMWSKVNREKVQKLIDEGRMMPSGLTEIERAKEDGRWDAAYDSPKNMQIPPDFLKALASSKKAKAFFPTLNKTNTFAIAWRLQTAKKPETREKRIKAILEMLERGETLH